MKAISEFSFSFAFTRELLTHLPNIDAAPYFPSLRAEAQLGYDLKIGFQGLPMFIQFKLAEGLTRRQAKYWAQYNREYYRFDITSRRVSQQHADLKDLSLNEPEVYYVAPVFWTIEDFNNYYASNQILANSICVPLQRLPYLSDLNLHQITYAAPERFDWHSTDDDTTRDDFSGTRLADSIGDRFNRRDLITIDENYIRVLHLTILSIIERRAEGIRAPTNVASGLEGLAGVQFLLRTYFGLELLLLRDLAALGA